MGGPRPRGPEASYADSLDGLEDVVSSWYSHLEGTRMAVLFLFVILSTVSCASCPSLFTYLCRFLHAESL